ncbi:hypothetical protein BGW38_002283 [Lunasporangiospora selenospora]|uniref:Uncharacterized protein n=1 Tax=Lunasporangiospora selenospora TaxID=979761 RepID=A0A9P6FST0_9FUNG|nr:hypothetical protein BGW38_002283 [Lunasporangiospora selenospora]
MASISAEYVTLGNSFRALHAQKGHWDGADPNPATDNFDGDKHQVMQKLGEHFGKRGTPAKDILSTMGKPDDVRASLDSDENFQAAMMPGPVLGGGGSHQENLATGAGLGDVGTTMMPNSAAEQGMYFIYKWRGNHDYLWFKIDAIDEKVIESSWYHAYE